MGYRNVEYAIKHLSGIPHNEFRVLVTLLSYRNETDPSRKNQCNPMMETLEKETGLCRRQISRLVKSLKERGAVTVTEKPTRNGKSNWYEFPCLQEGWDISVQGTGHQMSPPHETSDVSLTGNEEPGKEPGTSITVADAPGITPTEKSKGNPEKEKRAATKAAVRFWHSAMRKHGYESEGSLDGWHLEPLMQIWKLSDGPEFLEFCIANTPEGIPNPTNVVDNFRYFCELYSKDAA